MIFVEWQFFMFIFFSDVYNVLAFIFSFLWKKNQFSNLNSLFHCAMSELLQYVQEKSFA